MSGVRFARRTRAMSGSMGAGPHPWTDASVGDGSEVVEVDEADRRICVEVV